MRERRQNVRLDFNAYGIPEGMHPCYHRAGSGPQDFGKSVGVLVRDGQFVIPTTHAAIFETVCHSYGTTANAVRTGEDFIDHIFIEELTWDHDRKAVRIGPARKSDASHRRLHGIASPSYRIVGNIIEKPAATRRREEIADQTLHPAGGQIPYIAPCCPCGTGGTPDYCGVNDRRCPCRAIVQPDGYGGPCAQGCQCWDSEPARSINNRKLR